MLEDTRTHLAELFEENDNILLMGDFNCKEISRENWTTEGSEPSWGEQATRPGY